MSRYIDADKYLDELDKRICSDCIDEDAHCCSCGVGSARAIAKDAPTADVVEVVRCKDCKYCFHYIRPNYDRYECEYHGSSDEVVDYVEAMHYCSYGERRETNGDK